MKWLKAVPALALLALAFPASALAHTGAATVSCTGADLTFTAFAAGANTVNYRVTVDGATFRQGTFTLPGDGTAGTLHVPYALNDTHTVEAFAWWGPENIHDGHTRLESSPALASQQVDCPASPPTTPPATAPDDHDDAAAGRDAAGPARGRDRPRPDARLGRGRYAGPVGDRQPGRPALVRVAHRARPRVGPPDPPGHAARQRPPRAHRERAREPALRDGPRAPAPVRLRAPAHPGARDVPQRRPGADPHRARDAVRAR
jgi:hypothetical protein